LNKQVVIMKKNILILAGAMLIVNLSGFSQNETREQQAAKTEVWKPVPPIITPSDKSGGAPSDAIILFNGDSLNEWVSSKDSTKPATWTVSGDVFMVNKPAGNIQTKRSFNDYQLHVEWRIPKNITGSGQARGNSGIFLGGWGAGDGGYEIQVLDSYKNETYVNGQAGSIYKQQIPLVNVNRPPGEWNVYDIVWTAPRFNDDGSLKSPGRVTAFLNGALVQNNAEVKGDTRWIGKPEYRKHGALPVKLQSHGDPSEPISFRNIWIRPL
jgi:hypothetical protein